MCFFDENPLNMPFDAQYYFNVCVINIAVRRSLGGEFEDIWDLSEITGPRPYVIHIFLDEEDTFEDDRKWDIEMMHHCIVEVSDSLGVSFYVSESTDIDLDDGCGDFFDPNDFWRF